MGKSKYPNKLDTSVEIPVVRDNITEIGSDVLNSLRSAIFNIEKTLGINPNGTTGNTVASRINNSLDDNGNIKEEALNKAGLLSGPIDDNDVSKNAGISEEKLRLNYPTQLLQDQVSILDSRLILLIQSLEELNAIISAHIHSEASNRHKAKAITVEDFDPNPSSSAAFSLDVQTAQDAFEEIYNSHVKYTGEGISLDNNSHNSSQIFYDNDQTSDIIQSNSVQGAIDDIADIQGASLRDSVLNLNSNGIIRTGSVFDAYEQGEKTNILVPASQISYTGPDGNSRDLISFLDTPIAQGDIGIFDILTIIDSPNEDDNKDYLIDSFNVQPTGEVLSVTVLGGPKHPYEVGINAEIRKSEFRPYNENGLNCVARPRYLRSNIPDIQVANPNAATIISSGIRPANIVSGANDLLTLEIDGSSYEINVFDEDFEVQSLDTIVHKINTYCVENKLNAFAYKVRSLKCYELAITHVLPNFSEDTRNRTLKITEGSDVSQAYQALGLEYILNREVEGFNSNVCHINGRLISSFGKMKLYSYESLALNQGTTNIVTTALNFFEEDIREGDLCTIDGANNEEDNGTYRIHSVEDQTLILDSVGAVFSGTLNESSRVIIQRTSAPLSELEFLAADGPIIIDIFMTEDGDINFRVRAEVLGRIEDAGFYGLVTDISRGFITGDNDFELRVNTSGYARLARMPSGELGPEVFVGFTGRHKVMSPDKYNFVILDVLSSNLLGSNDTVTISGRPETPDSVMHLCRINYSTENGFVLGSPADTGGGIPVILDKRTTGTIDDTIISENIIERYIQGPRNELRGTGIIRDLNIISVVDNDPLTMTPNPTCSISVSPGVSVVNGVRVESFGIINLLYNYQDLGTSFYIGIDGTGCLIVRPEVSISGNPKSPFLNQNIASIAKVDIDPGSSVTITDLRLFVDHLDYKVLNQIIVSKDIRFGHFTDLNSAVDYARMFSEMFMDLGPPNIYIAEGEYTVNSRLVIDFDVDIIGAGPKSIIRRGESLHNNGGLEEVHFSDEEYNNFIFLIGSETNRDSSKLQSGVSFRNFSIYTSNTMDNAVGVDTDDPDTLLCYNVVFGITQSITENPNIRFDFSKINFYGPSSLQTAVVHEFFIFLFPKDILTDTNTVIGNLFVDNCYIKSAGNEKCCIVATTNNDSSCTIKNINISNNIFEGISPNQGGSAATSWNPISISSGPDVETGVVGAGFDAGEAMYEPYIANVVNVIASGNTSSD